MWKRYAAIAGFIAESRLNNKIGFIRIHKIFLIEKTPKGASQASLMGLDMTTKKAARVRQPFKKVKFITLNYFFG
jgi:hypothetical protein